MQTLKLDNLRDRVIARLHDAGPQGLTITELAAAIVAADFDGVYTTVSPTTVQSIVDWYEQVLREVRLLSWMLVNEHRVEFHYNTHVRWIYRDRDVAAPVRLPPREPLIAGYEPGPTDGAGRTCSGDIATCQREWGECSVCAIRDCPSKEPLHYHHDGCPACDVP